MSRFSLRTILRAVSPWRYGWTCAGCGRVEPCRWIDRSGRDLGNALVLALSCCGHPVPLVRRALAPWVRRWSVYVAVLLGALAGLVLASRVDARDAGSYVLQWREPIMVVWEAGCERPAEEQLVAELEAGWSRVQADLASSGGTPGPLGDLPFRPYTLRFEVAPRCPGGASACSTSRLEYREARFDCDGGGVRAVDHELEHRKAWQLRTIIKLLGRQVDYVVKWAGHHERNDKARPVLGVLGRPRSDSAVAEKTKKGKP